MTKQCPVCQSAKIKQFNGNQFKKACNFLRTASARVIASG